MTKTTVREAERFLKRVDPVMRKVIPQYGPCPFGVGRSDYFDALCWSIIGQQLSTTAARTIGGRVLELIDSSKMSALPISRASHDELRAAGLSNNKARFLQSLADETLDGSLNFRSLAQLPDEAVIERLVQLKGIGRWTAEMFLMSALKRSDVASPDDVGLQRGMFKLYNLRKRPSPRRFFEIARPWSPYRTVACWYLWRVAG